MAVYKIFPEKDATLYSEYPNANTGIDEIIEATTSTETDGGEPAVSRFLIKFNQSEILGDRDNLSESNQIIEIKLLSSPELLVKQPGFSKFGDWVYVSQDIKLGKRPKLDYQIISAFHAYLLADIQGIQPETSWLILRGKAPYSVDLEQRLPKMHDVLNNYLNMVLSRQEPEVFIARQKCNLCQWHSYCLDVARSQLFGNCDRRFGIVHDRTFGNF